MLKRARATKHPWMVACDANMSPVDFARKDQMHVTAPEGASTCRSKSAEGEFVEKVYGNVIACNSLKGKISQMKVVEDFESWPRNAVFIVVVYRNETSRSYRRCCLETVEEGCQEEA